MVAVPGAGREGAQSAAEQEYEAVQVVTRVGGVVDHMAARALGEISQYVFSMARGAGLAAGWSPTGKRRATDALTRARRISARHR